MTDAGVAPSLERDVPRRRRRATTPETPGHGAQRAARRRRDRAARTGCGAGRTSRRSPAIVWSSTFSPRWIITTWSHSCSACVMMCVEKSTVAPRRCSSSTRSRSSRWFTGSRPLNGSSRISRSGRWIDRGDELHLLLHPLRQLLAPLVLARRRGPRAPATRLTRAATSAPSRPFSVRHVDEELADAHLLVEAALLGQVADPVLRLERRRRGRARVSSPRSGKRIDRIIRIIVVLPAPFGPMTP